MNKSALVDDLVSLWQQAAGQGRYLSAEELCREQPELLAVLQQKIEFLRQMERLPPGAASVDATKSQSISLLDAMHRRDDELATLPCIAGYEMVRQLGKGGMGVVYEARDCKLDRTVAIKMLRHGALGDAQRQRFLAEAKAIASLNHPHIVQLFAIGEQDSQPFLIMELVRGATLQQCMAGQAQPPRQAARLIMLLARAAHAAHEQGIVHRDLKPGNVLLAPSLSDPALNSDYGCPKVSDFGLALRVGGTAEIRAREVAGTPSYMAPEQAEGRVEDIGPGTDVYALGAILYELLAVRPPFRGVTATATLWQVTHDEPVAPRLLQPDTPRDLDTICLKCLQKPIARRYASAQALADDLQRFLQGEPIEARPVGSIERAWKWVRRKPIVTALGGGILLTLVAAFAGVLYGWRQAESARIHESKRADAEHGKFVESEKRSYGHLIALSERNLAAGKFAWAEANLRACPAWLRQWEWYHLWHRSRQPDVTTLTGHAHGVSCVASAGEWIAAADGDGAIIVWGGRTDVSFPSHWGASFAGLLALPTGTADALAATVQALGPLRILRGHRGSANWVSFNAAGNELLSGGEDAKILVWNLDTGTEIDRFEAHDGPISCIAVHPTQPWIASTTFRGNQVGQVLIWSRTTKQVIHHLKGQDGIISGLSFAPDGETLAAASHDRTVMLWNTRTGEREQVFREHRFPIACVAFSPDGKTLAAAAGRLQSATPEESEILIWDRQSAQVRHRLRGHSDRVVTLVFAPDGQRLATAGWDRQIILWNLESGQEILSLTGHANIVTSLAFTKHRQLLSGSYDRTIRIWDSPLTE